MPQSTLLAVLFADVSGSTRLYESVGDQQALQHIGECLGLLKSTAGEYGGRVIKTIGDELMCAFPDADSAAQAAAGMQGQFDRRPPVAGVKLAIRVGFHFGPALEESGDVFGDTVNVAARMVGLAKSGQIITTREAVAALSPFLRANTRSLDAMAVKGKQEEIDVHEVLWQEGVDVTMVSGRLKVPRPAVGLRLVHAGREFRLDDNRTAVSLGRDAGNDIVITDRMASRHHARIERRRGKYVLTDQSTNGTYVTVRGDSEMQLKREEFILRASGTLCFGHGARPGAAEEFVEFYCE